MTAKPAPVAPPVDAYPFTLGANAPQIAWAHACLIFAFDAFAAEYAAAADATTFDEYDTMITALDENKVNMAALARVNPDLDPFADGTVAFEPGPITVSRILLYVERCIEYRILATWKEALDDD